MFNAVSDNLNNGVILKDTYMDGLLSVIKPTILDFLGFVSDG
jgi:hypothetical protein